MSLFLRSTSRTISEVSAAFLHLLFWSEVSSAISFILLMLDCGSYRNVKLRHASKPQSRGTQLMILRASEVTTVFRLRLVKTSSLCFQFSSSQPTTA